MAGAPDPKRLRASPAEAPLLQTAHWTLPTGASREELLGHEAIQQAASILASGQVVGFPTETVYGLGCDCTNDAAIQRVYAAKGRPSDNPLIAHVCSEFQAEALATDIPPVARTLMKEYWPGPLTLILRAQSGKVSTRCTAGLGTVGIRMPNHPVALALIEASGCALAAPSANTSGRPSPTMAKHVSDDLDGRVAGVLDGGATGVGLESTVLDCTTNVDQNILNLLRPGGVTLRMLQDTLRNSHPEMHVQAPASDKLGNESNSAVPRAPGMKYTHYAPKSPLFLVRGDYTKLQEASAAARAKGQRVGIICSVEDGEALRNAADQVLICGSQANLESIATSLFAVLRDFDAFEGDEAVDVIFCHDFSKLGEEGGLRDAIANRLNKAAGGQIIE